MFERRFAKYARAISDEGERRSLYKKYSVRLSSYFIGDSVEGFADEFYVLCGNN